MKTRVLITGGAGFIGSHAADLLLAQGYDVAILDSLVAQVHGEEAAKTGDWPEWTLDQVGNGLRHVYLADVRDRTQVAAALVNFRPHVVVHLAAEVGVGQAEVEIERYVDANVRGTAVLLEEILRANDTVQDSDDGVRRLVVAGSMSSYGEGAWTCPIHGLQRATRTAVDLASGIWAPRCFGPALEGGAGACEAAEPMAPAPVQEWASLRPLGVYAATKRDAEDLSLLVARARGLSVAVTRFFNVYGPRQAISNPYTGVCAIFAGRVLRGRAPLVYEDGGQLRDFVHVSDVARAIGVLCGNPETALAMRKWADPRTQGPFNVGTGIGTSILRVAELACEELGTQLVTGAEIVDGEIRPVSTEPAIRPEVTGLFRTGDVRACLAAATVADGSPSRIGALGWQPTITADGPDGGLRHLFRSWRGTIPDGDLDAAHTQIERAGLLHRPVSAVDEEPAPAGNRWGG